MMRDRLAEVTLPESSRSFAGYPFGERLWKWL
jgi:hypothetical protein